ncbi:MAG: hypothetical protein ACO2O0_03685 [Desulfurococcales archaeon]|jgi:hypothetical protein
MKGVERKEEQSIVRSVLEHLKSHVTYPASGAEVLEACNKGADLPRAERTWLAQALKDSQSKRYSDPIEVLRDIITKV